jgi:hypothetical protein
VEPKTVALSLYSGYRGDSPASGSCFRKCAGWRATPREPSVDWQEHRRTGFFDGLVDAAAAWTDAVERARVALRGAGAGGGERGRRLAAIEALRAAMAMQGAAVGRAEDALADAVKARRRVVDELVHGGGSSKYGRKLGREEFLAAHMHATGALPGGSPEPSPTSSASVASFLRSTK